MKSIISTILSFLLLFSAASAFTATPVSFGGVSVNSVSSRSDVSLNMVFGKKKSAAAKAEEEARAAMYWAGEWVCKDCGYIYQKGECAGLYFEEQTAGFRCPQCSGPRRRYAKKVGDVVGTTLDGGDAPILIFSFGGVLATIAFGIWAVDNL
uniref:Rubredoxin-like domain-containing protein n=1 Tax=Eucampia antarctica TaxID=49252 RepID=A0A6U0RS20_9STRA|mmetsp:Transcript_23644/g.22671  ORF Transcript_23644/g.22671 Transcript_23644/m.22671 type:complete len:152 (+) Transcript_23644:145-600(+)